MTPPTEDFSNPRGRFWPEFFREFSKLGHYLAVAIAAMAFSAIFKLFDVQGIQSSWGNVRLEPAIKQNAEKLVLLNQDVNETKGELLKLEQAKAKITPHQQVTLSSFAATPATANDIKVQEEVKQTVLSNTHAVPQSIEGSVWVGNYYSAKQQFIVSNFRKPNGTLIKNLNELQQGIHLVSRDNLVIRSDYPEPIAQGYFYNREQVGLVDIGDEVVVQGEPKKYALGSKVQVWIRVQVVPKTVVR